MIYCTVKSIQRVNNRFPVYPHMAIPLFVGRERSIVALDRAMNAGKKILLIAQQKADLDDPQPEDLYDVGTLATILQLLKLS